MKKFLVAAALAGTCVMETSAQNIIERPTFGDNWNIVIDVGATSPLKGHSFFQNMRPTVGLTSAKQLTPLFGVGVERYIRDQHLIGQRTPPQPHRI